MEKFLKYFMLVLFASAVMLAGCSDDDDDNQPTTPVTSTYDLLKDYLISNNMDADNIIADWITSAEGVFTTGVENFYIIDIRGEADFQAGHIEGAVNSTLDNILTTAEAANGKPVIVVCYTGQIAGHAVMALRLSGYADAKVMKWGMSGWNQATSAPWANNTGDVAIGHANWAAAPGNITPNAEFAYPVLQSSSQDGATILAERVAALLAGGFNGITNADVLAAPANYFINNYWAEGDVEHYGHIAGAYRILPFTLKDGNDKNLDASKAVVTYCWTGQTSSMMTAYLKVLGYDAKSLLFGANGMIFSNLESHKYPGAADYPLVTK